MTEVSAWAASAPGKPFQPFTYQLNAIQDDEVDIAVDYCGLCHTDICMWENQWQVSQYPFVGGHEVVGRVLSVGSGVQNLSVGDKVGLGWFSRSDLTTQQSLCGDHNLSPGNSVTIRGRHGGFANIVRCQWVWAVPLPDDLDLSSAGPLFCGGITVFNPIVQFNVAPTDRVAVVGIGGLGHLATQFLNKWGCEVTAFTSSADKAAEAKRFGAHHTLDSRDSSSWAAAKGRFDFILVTVNVPLDWHKLVATLSPRGRLHFVGAIPQPIGFHAPTMMTGGQRQMSASPLGAPATIAKMLEFCGRHDIRPLTEQFKLSQINEAMAHLQSGQARYRIVLENDFPGNG